jgi:CBS domain-containing membrane protein
MAAKRASRGPGSAQHHYTYYGPSFPELLHGIGVRLRWKRLAERHDARFLLGALALVNGTVSIGLMALAAKLSRQPLVFPSLGPTAFVLFYRPHAEASSPRNVLIGHLIGALAGLGSLAAFGLLGQGPSLTHLTTPRIGAAALSLGLTAAVMIWAGVPHPPAGATTLIVSLGFLHSVSAVSFLMLGVLLLVAQGVLVNRWAGIDYPLWAPHRAVSLTVSSRRPPVGEDPPTRYTIFVDATGTSPAGDPACARLRSALHGQASALTVTPEEWTATFTVDARDVEQAAAGVRRCAEAANEAAGLSDWECECFQVRETLVRLGDEPPHWHPHLPLHAAVAAGSLPKERPRG